MRTDLDDPAAGWYRHPEHPGVERYWDGASWSGEHRFAPVPDQPATAARPELPATELLAQRAAAWWATPSSGDRYAARARLAACGFVLALLAVCEIAAGPLTRAVLAILVLPLGLGLLARGRWLLALTAAVGLSAGAFYVYMAQATVCDFSTFLTRVANALGADEPTGCPTNYAYVLLGALLGAAWTATGEAARGSRGDPRAGRRRPALRCFCGVR